MCDPDPDLTLALTMITTFTRALQALDIAGLVGCLPGMGTACRHVPKGLGRHVPEGLILPCQSGGPGEGHTREQVAVAVACTQEQLTLQGEMGARRGQDGEGEEKLIGSVEQSIRAAEPQPEDKLARFETLFQDLFNRYDVDQSGSLNSSDEVRMLTVNMCYQLGVGLNMELLEEKIDGLGDIADCNAMGVAEYRGWFKSDIMQMPK